MTIKWCMVPEILSTTDRFICHFGALFVLLPPNNLKNQNSGKMKKTPGDIIILQMCTINYNHMMYGSWNIECDGHHFLSLWTIFHPFTHKNPKNQNFEKRKKAWRYYHFTQVYQKSWSYYTIPEIWHVTDVLPRDVIILHKCAKNYDHMVYCSWDMARDRWNCCFSF